MPIGPEHLALFIPILVLLIPIIAIVLSHQRRMAELMHQHLPQGNAYSDHQIEALRREVAELKQLVQQQVIAVDTLSRQTAMVPTPGRTPMPEMELRERTL